MDPSELAALFGQEEDGSDTLALASALRGQEQAGLLGLLTGDKVLSGVGTQLLSGAKTRKEGALRKAMAVADAKRQAQAAAAQREHQLADKTAANEQWLKQNAITSGQQDQRTQMMADAQYQREKRATEQREEERFQDDTKDYAKAIPEGAATFFEQTRAVDSILSKPESKEDIPGVGAYDSRKPKAVSTEDDLEMQKNVGQMMLSYQKLVTGTGGGAEELKKIADAGADMANEKSFRKGYESLKKNYTAYLKKVQGGFRPEVVQNFERRVPGMRIPTAPVTPGMSLESNVDTAAPQAPPANPKAAAALKWARENASDPRAAAILKKLGLTQ